MRLLLPFVAILVFVLSMVSSTPSYAVLQKCPWFSTCSGPFTQLPGMSPPPQAAYCGQGGRSCCDCDTFKNDFRTQMQTHRTGYLLGTYWTETVEPGLRALLSKISVTMQQQSATRGGFTDAAGNMNAITALQEGQAESARNYLPSEQLCRFASLSEGLGYNDVKRSTNQIQLATIGLKRNLGSEGAAAEDGSAGDNRARRDVFIKEYCIPNQGMTEMCGTSPTRIFGSVPRDQRYTRDVSYTRVIEDANTIDIDPVAEINPTATNQDITTLAANLYGARQIANRFTRSQMGDADNYNAFLTTRAVAANRSVAENTYTTISAMKAKGSAQPQPFMKALLTELGVDANAAGGKLGPRPSYYAQMDFLTKKIYQDPVFYINLMEGKTNVSRQSAAMEGIEIMQDRDLYQSMRRSEMLMALLVELQSRDMMNKTIENIKTTSTTDTN